MRLGKRPLAGPRPGAPVSPSDNAGPRCPGHGWPDPWAPPASPGCARGPTVAVTAVSAFRTLRAGFHPAYRPCRHWLGVPGRTGRTVSALGPSCRPGPAVALHPGWTGAAVSDAGPSNPRSAFRGSTRSAFGTSRTSHRCRAMAARPDAAGSPSGPGAPAHRQVRLASAPTCARQVRAGPGTGTFNQATCTPPTCDGRLVPLRRR